MGAVISVIVSTVLRFLGDSVVRWLAFKVLMFALFTVVLPLILVKGWFLIQSYVLGFLMSNIDSEQVFTSNHVLQLTGVSAYIATAMNLPHSVSVLIGGAVNSFVIGFIKR